jgi:hypothetical protein
MVMFSAVSALDGGSRQAQPTNIDTPIFDQTNASVLLRLRFSTAHLAQGVSSPTAHPPIAVIMGTTISGHAASRRGRQILR